MKVKHTVSVLEDDEWTFASQFQGDTFKVRLCCCCHDELADLEYGMTNLLNHLLNSSSQHSIDFSMDVRLN